ncbi:MAG: hypothetical protein IT223_02815 [Crocinitomicaceae bacterium]|nr:hypothetical protein [Crocinitomicaceae bacterium]
MRCTIFTAFANLMRLLIFFLLIFLFVSGCNVINPNEEEPAYIYIDSFRFDTEPGEGSSSQKITELWVYAEEKMIGAFDLPARIPVLGKGATDIRIFAGIKNNGLSATRIRYPFYAPFDTTYSIQGGETFYCKPRFSYFDEVLVQEKGFESGNFLVPLGGNQGTFNVVNNDALVFEGDRSGIGTLESGQSLLYFKDDQNLDLSGGNTYFLEMNYSCNGRFAVGLLSTTGITIKKNLAVIINPTTTGINNPQWNKIYIDLGLIPQQNASADFFELYVEALPKPDNGKLEIYLDNLKMVEWE